MAALRDWRDGVDKETVLIMQRREKSLAAQRYSEKKFDDKLPQVEERDKPQEDSDLGEGSQVTGEGEAVTAWRPAAPRAPRVPPEKRGLSSREEEWLDKLVADIGHDATGLSKKNEESLTQEEEERAQKKAAEILRAIPAAVELANSKVGLEKKVVVPYSVTSLTPDLFDRTAQLIWAGLKKMHHDPKVEPIQGSTKLGRIYFTW